jgi:hypothetical protein
MNGVSNVSQLNNPVLVDGREVRPQEGDKAPIDLRQGQVLKGTVVSVTDTDGGKIADISVGDSVISAKLSDGMGLREGQTLNFAVRSSGSTQVSITPLLENTSASQSTITALNAAGIEVNNDTIQMVKDMMEASLPIGKDALLEMSKNLSTYPNTSISTMVEMKSLDIPINSNNIEQFESYKNYEHQVTSAMESIIDELPNAFSSLQGAGNDSQALNLYGSVLKLFGESIEGEAAASQATAEAAEAAEVTNAAAETESAETASAAEASASKVLTGKSATVTDTILSDQAKEIPKEAALLGNPRTGTALSEDFVTSLKNLGISDETINKYNEALKLQTESTEQAPEAAAKLETAQKQLLSELSKSFDSSDMNGVVDRAVWKNIFSHDDYNKLLKESISSQWLLKPKDVENKQNIDNLYQRLGNQIKGLAETISNNLGAESKLGQAANNLQNNLDFMNQLNQMFQYVQLPLQMTGQNVHGDLYVYRNKGRKLSEDGSVSAVLHLDMENLGPVDVYVKMLDTKVTTNFYVADDAVIDLINDNIHILNERLNKRGYTMDVTLKLQDDMDGQDAAVDEMLDVRKTPVISTNSFDARA